MDIIYIEPSVDDISNYRKNNSISISSIYNFTFGFKNLDQIILCHYNFHLKDELTIEFISPKRTGIDKLLILVEEKAKSLNIKKLLIFCIEFKNWYETLGFKLLFIYHQTFQKYID
jgi:hypothetical protein